MQNDWDCVALTTVASTAYTVTAGHAVYNPSAGDATTDLTRFRIYDDPADGHYDSFQRGTSDPVSALDVGPQTFVAAGATSYYLCFYSWISIDAQGEWADYQFRVMPQ